MKNKYIVAILAVAIAGVIGYIVYSNFERTKIDELAKCLTEKKVVFYGASWCPHCNEQKKLFGSSFKYLTYFECSTDESLPIDKVCSDKKIGRFPTWIMNDDFRIEGIYKLETLAKKFDCKYQ